MLSAEYSRDMSWDQTRRNAIRALHFKGRRVPMVRDGTVVYVRRNEMSPMIGETFDADGKTWTVAGIEQDGELLKLRVA